MSNLVETLVETLIYSRKKGTLVETREKGTLVETLDDSREKGTLIDLPDDILGVIFRQSSTKEGSAVAGVCKDFRKIANGANILTFIPKIALDKAGCCEARECKCDRLSREYFCIIHSCGEYRNNTHPMITRGKSRKAREAMTSR